MKVKARKPRSATLHWAACAAAMLLGALAAAAGALVPADSAYVRSLDGAWRFKLENPGAGAGRALGDKATPAEPAPAAGFFKLDYREGADWH
ncbi:MAG TPA: hypothetical protein VHH88_08280, partial [Verrucomicrobiae bacterium]|nr:hypothetical protein [Verrucomicrobiae bacterium]